MSRRAECNCINDANDPWWSKADLRIGRSRLALLLFREGASDIAVKLVGSAEPEQHAVTFNARGAASVGDFFQIIKARDMAALAVVEGRRLSAIKRCARKRPCADAIKLTMPVSSNPSSWNPSAATEGESASQAGMAASYLLAPLVDRCQSPHYSSLVRTLFLPFIGSSPGHKFIRSLWTCLFGRDREPFQLSSAAGPKGIALRTGIGCGSERKENWSSVEAASKLAVDASRSRIEFTAFNRACCHSLVSARNRPMGASSGPAHPQVS